MHFWKPVQCGTKVARVAALGNCLFRAKNWNRHPQSILPTKWSLLQSSQQGSTKTQKWLFINTIRYTFFFYTFMDLRLRHKNENPVRKSSDFLSGSSGFKVHLIYKDTKYCSKKGTWKTPRRKDSGDAIQWSLPWFPRKASTIEINAGWKKRRFILQRNAGESTVEHQCVNLYTLYRTCVEIIFVSSISQKQHCTVFQ